MRKLALTLLCIMTFKYLSSGTKQFQHIPYIKVSNDSDQETIEFNKAKSRYFKKVADAAALQLELQKQLENR